MISSNSSACKVQQAEMGRALFWIHLRAMTGKRTRQCGKKQMLPYHYYGSYLEGHLRESLLEHLALEPGDLELELGRVAAAVRAGESARAPWRA